tara:strand:+ start:8497 stop:8901 length:405 start_codon:yes stop_codon:yes gene_type:complete
MNNYFIYLLIIVVSLTGCFYNIGNDLSDNEIRFLNLEKQIKCPICPAETISESNTKVSNDLKKFIKQKIDEGWSDDKIKSFLISKYGKEILATPQKKGSDLFLWIIPLIVLILGLFVYWSLYKSIRIRFKKEKN